MSQMLQNKLMWILIILLLLIPGCSGGNELDPSSAPISIASTAVLPKSPTPIATSTILPSSTPSATPRPGEVEFQCIEIGDDPKALSNLSGTLVLNGDIVPIVDGKVIYQPSLLVDLTSGDQIPISENTVDERYAVSPGGSYLAFVAQYSSDYKEVQANIIDSKNNLLAEIAEKNFWSMEWLDDETLFLDARDTESNPLVALYPFINKRKILQPFVTENERIAPFDSERLFDWGFYGFHKIIYNPTFTRAIYASSDGVVFRDLTTNKDIATFGNGLWGMSPKWSPEGLRLALGLNTTAGSGWENRKYELVILDQNGKQLLMTNLSALPGPVYISSLSWSPDGSRVAFWYTTNEDENKELRLAVYDIETQKVKDYCIVKDFAYYQLHRNDASPIWSPDGNFLLISKADNMDKNPSVIIVDLQNERAAVVKSGYEPVGWMK